MRMPVIPGVGKESPQPQRNSWRSTATLPSPHDHPATKPRCSCTAPSRGPLLSALPMPHSASSLFTQTFPESLSRSLVARLTHLSTTPRGPPERASPNTHPTASSAAVSLCEAPHCPPKSQSCLLGRRMSEPLPDLPELSRFFCQTRCPQFQEH